MVPKLFVGNIAYSVDESKLESIFSEIEGFKSIKIVRDRETGNSKGFGFVEFETEDAANEAMEKFNGTDVDGRSLKVDKAKPQENRPPRQGGGGGRFQRGGGGGRGRF